MTALIDIVAGPTASGKSSLAADRAAAISGVVINADSMQIYDALPLLTAQPSAADRAAAPHRLYGVLPPGQPCNAAHWRMQAMAEIEDALTQGRTPIVVGGTGLYINSLLNGLSPMPDVPDAIRAEAMALQAVHGNPGFHARLADIDPAMAARLHPNDTQRLVRAFEVMLATGRSLSDWQAMPREGARAGWQFKVTLLLPDRANLYDRCNRRLDTMIDHGVLDEIAAFADRPDIDDAAPVKQALGYSPLLDYLQGLNPRDHAIERAKAETRQYAKRQVTWFRHQIVPLPNKIDIVIQT